MTSSALYFRKIVKALIQLAALPVFISACTFQQTEVAGTYKTEDPNLIKKGWKYVFEGYEGFTTGTELELNTDSTFYMTTCANIITGTWHHTDDSLYLRYQTNRWKNDSLHEHGIDGKRLTITEEFTEVVQIEGNQLIWNNSKAEDGRKVYIVLEK
ncbi:hypothetical protein O3Q51_08665 [Cryomorphaceae bacterium 1068]|nr:hypothetical protein [Cryomorphaceae bacterium 1068]